MRFYFIVAQHVGFNCYYLAQHYNLLCDVTLAPNKTKISH